MVSAVRPSRPPTSRRRYTQGVDGHRDQPERGRRHGAGAAGSRRCQACRSSPSTAASTRSRASSPMSAPTTSRAARPRASWSMKLFPNGATIMNLQGQSGASPAIDRNKGLHNVLDKAAGQVQDRVRADRRLRPGQGPVGDRVGARRHGDAAGRDRRRQRRHGLGAHRGAEGAQLSTRSSRSASTRCPRRWRRSATAR